MTRDTLRSSFLFALLAGTVLGGPGVPAPVAAGEGPVAREFPAGIGDAYRTLSESITAEDLPTFMRLFHLDFIYEGLDGASHDRGPWRRLWMDRFADLAYERVAFNPVEVLEEEEERVVISVRRVAVFESPDDGSRQLEEIIFQDTWVKSETGWELELSAETEVVSRGAVADEGERVISSPRLRALAASLRRREEDATGKFWKDVRASGAPLVEAIDGDPQHRRVTFLWRGEGKETSVRVRGGLPAAESSKPLTRLGKSDVWYRSERMPASARFTYKFDVANGVAIPASGEEPAEVLSVRSAAADPLNPRSLDGASLAELPAAPPVTWLESVDGRPRGEVKRHAIASEVLGERRFVTVYTPPGYEELDSPCVAAFVIDDGSYKSRRVTGTVLDNLIAEKKIRPTVLFMVHGEGSRSETLEASGSVVRFLGEELVAWARQSFRVHTLARHTVIGGSGLGGLLAVAVAMEYPETFGEVVAENGAFSHCIDASGASSGSSEHRLCIQRRLAVGEKLPLRFFLVVGSLEGAAARDSGLHLRDVLEARGYSTEFRLVAANRHATTWQDALARWLMALVSE